MSMNELTPQDLEHDVIVIRLTDRYEAKVNEHGSGSLTAQELYDITRSCWHITKEKVAPFKIVLSVYEGEVKEVYTVCDWYDHFTTFNENRGKPPRKPRIEFIGDVAPADIRSCYLGKTLKGFFEKGAVNPIATFRKPSKRVL